jgi:Flp pilus assembly protein TadD
MRVLFFVLVIFVLSLAAQTPNVKKAFDAGTQNARGGQFETAIENYRRTLLLAGIERPNDDFLARVHFNLGVCFYRLKQAEKAAAQFSEAVKLSGRTYQKAFYALAMVQKDLGNLKKAENAFRDALKIEETDGEAWFDLALLYLQKQDFDAAFSAFENAIRFKSVASAEARNNLGVIFALRRDFDSAEKEFEKALTISDGKLNVARSNLQFCRFYRQKNQFKNLIARLEFSLTSRNEISD